MNVLNWIDQRKHWWKVFVIIFVISVSVVGYIGYKTYEFAPPIADFVAEDGELVFTAQDITSGQQVFFRHGLMEYGSFLGDGGMRGPDYTAEALSFIARSMSAYYDDSLKERISNERERRAVVSARVQRELKQNRYDARYYGARIPDAQTPHQPGAIVLTAGQTAAFAQLRQYYAQVFGAGGDFAGVERFGPANYITDPQDIKELTAFYYWGAWLSAAERPGFGYSYTHNWPYDPSAGNAPHGGLVLWSIVGAFVLILACGLILYYYGKLDHQEFLEQQKSRAPPLAAMDAVDRFAPTPTQRATYKYFAVAALLFLAQVLAGLLVLSDFISALGFSDTAFARLLPITVTRAWHSQISVLWIAVCWFASTIWILPMICRPEPSRQLAWVNALFWMLLIVAAGAVFGIPLGINGALSESATRWFGLQGWEYMQIGRVYQYVLFSAFVVWLIIVARGLWPVLRQKQSWSLPNWMVYTIAGVILMFTASFVADPDTNFVIGDFWRWVTIHMWVEAFFELFTTIIVAYFLYLMGFVSHLAAARVIYLGAVLFLGSGLIGISHNFYWNAKSIETVALGGVLSTLQVVPLILLTLQSWRFRNMPQSTVQQLRHTRGDGVTFGLSEAFLFLIGVNFWNFFGAGALGFMVNLPIVNYYQHGTYLTANHAHAALMGVYGNLAIAAMLFCGRWNLSPQRWNAKLLRMSFWALNIGLALMVVGDLFPKGVHQLITVMNEGYAYARSQAYVTSDPFQMLTALRVVGAALFVLVGVIPLVWFMVTRWVHLKRPQTPTEWFAAPPSVLAAAPTATAEAGTRS